MQRVDSQSSFDDLVLLDGASMHFDMNGEMEHPLQQCKKCSSEVAGVEAQLAKLFSMYRHFQKEQPPKCSRKSSMPSSGSLPAPVVFKRAMRKSTASIAP
jgi:hypothetical protein